MQGATEDELLHVAARERSARRFQPCRLGAAHVEALDQAARVRPRRAAPQHAGTREKADVAWRSSTAFSQTGRSPTTPAACRSSGMRATPARTQAPGEAASARPATSTVPASAACKPEQQPGERLLAVAGNAGDGDDLAGADVQVGDIEPPGSPRRHQPHAAHGTSAGAAADASAAARARRCAGSTRRPTMVSASSALSAPAAGKVAIEPAGAQHGDAVRDAQHFVELVADEDDAEAFAPPVAAGCRTATGTRPA